MVNHRKKALLNLLWIPLALLVWYLAEGTPCFSREQEDRYALAKNLASNMEILEIIPIPEGSGRFDAQAEEWLYLLRYEDTYATMSTFLNQVGNNVYGGSSDYVVEYDVREGMAIIPLYGLGDTLTCEAAEVAVIPTNPEIVRIEVTYCSDLDSQVSTFATEERYEGIFVATCTDLDYVYFSSYYNNGFSDYNLGAIGYDANGNEIARTKGIWEANYETE